MIAWILGATPRDLGSVIGMAAAAASVEDSFIWYMENLTE